MRARPFPATAGDASQPATWVVFACQSVSCTFSYVALRSLWRRDKVPWRSLGGDARLGSGPQTAFAAYENVHDAL
jgi:hypothetical protein